MDREIELKLECEPDALDRVRRSPALSRLKQGKASAKTLRSIYFDTEDFALMENGLALRVREVGAKRIQTLKTDSEGKGPASDRGEWEAALQSDGDGPDLNRLPAALRNRIRKLAPNGNLSPRLVSDIRRTASRLRTEDGSEIEFAIDSGTMRANGLEIPISELELELKHGAPANLYRLALALADVAPMRIGMRSKAARGRALAMGVRPQAMRAEAVEIPRDASVEDAYALILRHCLTHLLSNEAAAFEGASSEGLHQMRVALRRLRSAFIAFGGLTRGDTADDMAREAKWLTRAIGHARDSDVFLSEIIAPVVAGDPGDKGLIALSAAAEKAQGNAWASAREAVRSPRMTRFVLRLALYLDERGWRGEKDADLEALKAPVSEFASAALDKRLKKVTKLARDIDHLEIDERHELRKRLKKLRYTLSFFSALFPRAQTKSYLHHLTGLQDVFGALNDLETAHGIVNELGRAHPRLAVPGARLLGFHEKRARKEWQSALKMWRNFRDQTAFWR
ncbi:MAG TPA: CHAD domain-containing protein [Parvibaculum sp.]|jgi:inorganic triphosphatase YgiF